MNVEDVAVEAQLAAAATAAAAAVEKAETEAAAAAAAEKAETEAGQSRTPRAGAEPKSSFEFTPLAELARTHGSLEDAEDAPPLAPPVDAQGSLSDDDDDEIKLVAEVKPTKKRGRPGKEKPQQEPKEPKKRQKRGRRSKEKEQEEQEETVTGETVTGYTLEQLLTGVFPFKRADIGEDIYFRSFPRQRKKANGQPTTTNDFQYVRYDKDQGKVVPFRGVDANGYSKTGKVSPFLRSGLAVTRWENLFLKGLIEDTTTAATVVTRAAPTRCTRRV